jgi:hypothetical protein
VKEEKSKKNIDHSNPIGFVPEPNKNYE